MGRTKDVSSRKAGVKAPRKIRVVNPRAKISKSKKSRRPSLNAAIQRPVPGWQKPITNFYTIHSLEKKGHSDNDNNKLSENEPEIITLSDSDFSNHSEGEKQSEEANDFLNEDLDSTLENDDIWPSSRDVEDDAINISAPGPSSKAVEDYAINISAPGPSSKAVEDEAINISAPGPSRRAVEDDAINISAPGPNSRAVEDDCSDVEEIEANEQNSSGDFHSPSEGSELETD